MFPSYLRSAYRSVTSVVLQMDIQEWAIVGICILLVGCICMRGFGSRETY